MALQNLNQQFPFDNTQAVMSSLRNLMVALEARFTDLESARRTYSAELASFQANGLEKIDEVISPLLAQVQAQLAQGGVFNGESTSLNTFGTGLRAFTLNDPAIWATFTPSRFMAAISGVKPANLMTGEVISFRRDTGELTINVTLASADTPSASDWYIGPATQVAIPQAVDPGFYDDSGPLVGSTPIDATQVIDAIGIYA